MFRFRFSERRVRALCVTFKMHAAPRAAGHPSPSAAPSNRVRHCTTNSFRLGVFASVLATYLGRAARRIRVNNVATHMHNAHMSVAITGL